MKHVVFAFLLILLTSCAFAGFSAPTTKDQPILVESDSDFYYSDKGIVTIDLNLTGKDILTKDFFVRILGLEDANVWVKELSFNKAKTETTAYLSSVQSKTKLSVVGLQKVPMQIVLQYDINKIGLGKEFIVRLETKDGTLVADLDPFLSGYAYRAQWCLNTDGIGLSADITNDHVIAFHKGASDTNFWNAIQADGDDIRWTDLSNNSYNWHFENFDYANKDFNAWVGVTQTFTSASDTCGYLYYGNASATSNQSASATFPDSYNANWHLNEASGNPTDSTANNVAGTASSIIYGQNGKVGKDFNFFQPNTYGKVDLNSSNYFMTSAFTWCFWGRKTNNENDTFFFVVKSKSPIESASDISYSFDYGWALSTKFAVYTGNTEKQVAYGNVAVNEWHYYCGSYDGTRIYGWLDGTLKTPVAVGGAINDSSASGATRFGTRPDNYTGLKGSMDEVRYFDSNITTNEVLLFYNNQASTSFVTFSNQEVGNETPYIKVLVPTADLNWNGTKTIDFNVSDAQATDTLAVTLFYSSTAGAKTTRIVHDANLKDASTITCVPDYVFTTQRKCSYSWNTTTASDGLYYIDANISDGTDTNISSSPRFRVDNTKPVTTYSGCGTDWNKVNQTITLSCADAGSLCNGTQYRVDAGAWQTYTTPFALTTDANHSIDYNSTDKATNQEVTKTSYCAIDKTAPIYSGVDNNSVWKKANFYINFNGLNFNVSGKKSAQYRVDAGAWGNFASDYNVAITSDGNYSIDANFTDNANNSLVISNVRALLDKTAPVTSFSGCTAGWKTTLQTITLSCSDATSGCNGTTYQIDGAGFGAYSVPFALTTDGNHAIQYTSIDVATNQEVTKTSYCAIDQNAPVVASTTFIGFTIFGAFINGVGSVLGGLATDIISGIDQATCEYTINGGGAWLSAVWDTDHCVKTGITISDGTIYNGNTRVDDIAGNTGTGTGTGNYTGDTTAPTTTDNASNTWGNSNQTVTLTCGDGAGAGCKNTYYCVDTAGSCTPTTIGTSVAVNCTAGNVCLQYVRYFSQDNVDNNETAHNSVLTRIDKQAPTTTKTGCTAGWHNTNQDVNFSCDDGTGSGCNDTNVRIDGGAWNEVSTINLTTDANHFIEYFSNDAVSNQETTKSFYCAIDQNAPTYESIDGNGAHTTAFYVNVNGVNFDIAGKKSAQYRIDAGSWTDFTTDYNVHITVDGNYLIDFNFTDNANNSLIISGIDANLNGVPVPPQEPPEITIIQPNGAEVFIKTIDLATIIIRLKDPDTDELYVDLNYSTTLVVGSGTPIIVNENVLTSPNLLCASADFSSDVDCSYSWDITGIDDGNYYIHGLVSDGNLTATDFSNASFEIKSPSQAIVSTDYVERYIAPDSKQRDSNIYFNPTSMFALTESEKQTSILQTTQTNIFLFGLIIIAILAVLAWFIWKRK